MTPPPATAAVPTADRPRRRGHADHRRDARRRHRPPRRPGRRTRRPAARWCWSACCWSRSTCAPRSPASARCSTRYATGLALSGAMAGLVTTLPTIAFAGLGALTPWLVRRFAPARVLVVAMLALAVGQVLRVVTDSAVVFVLTSALALAGIAVANILLPMLVKQHFPHRTGLVTGAYTMTLTIGTTVAAASAVPVAHAFGSWRAGLGVWAGLAAVAVLPWVPLALRARAAAAAGDPDGGRRHPGPDPARTDPARLGDGGLLRGAVAQRVRDHGLAGAALPGRRLPPAGRRAAARRGDRARRADRAGDADPRRPAARRCARWCSSLTACSTAWPTSAWRSRRTTSRCSGSLLLALGQGAFPLILTTIGLRARTAEGTVALSAFAQSTGYVIAALGPLLVGILYEATGGWTVPIGFLLAALAVQTTAGLAIARPRYIEDE